MTRSPKGLLLLIGPGVLVAATGVGAGDLATAAFAGSKIGLAVLWAVVVGALVKLVLNEQLARWQLATGTTILEGALSKLGPVVWAVFGAYLLFWSPFVAAALMKACGAVLGAMIPGIPTWAGAVGCSLIGLVMVWIGGFKLFQRVMAVCIAVMVVVVLASAAASMPAPLEVLNGFIPRVPTDQQALGWTIALIGGVGGTLTIICYSYWMREAGRGKPEDLKTCRIDLAVGYSITAIFGLAMIVLAAGVAGDGVLEGRGSSIIVQVSIYIAIETHPAMRWAFLAGSFGAVFSSVLGVWQAVPYVFADWWRMRPGSSKAGRPMTAVSTTSLAYRGYLVALATLPCGLLFIQFATIQKLYTIIGACFIPLLAITLLLLMNRRSWIGSSLANRWASNIALTLAIAVSVVAAYWFIVPRVQSLLGS
ncbi:MAG: Nramp family divalent metal transporter [Planctomycetota bacterium]